MGENRALMRQIVEIFNTGDLSTVDSIFSRDYQDHQKPDGWEIDGPEEFRQIVTGARNSTRSLNVTIEDLIAEGDRVVARLRWHGVDLTGTITDRETLDMLRIEKGKVIEHWGGETWRSTKK